MNKYQKKICVTITLIALLFSTIPNTSTTISLAKSQKAKSKIQYVYIAASGRGECYHLSKKCSRMRGRVVKMKLKKAKKNYRPCSKCYN